MAHILRSNIGPQFTRRSIGQVTRLLTNIILFSSAKGLVLLSFWTLSLWNFDIDTVPMTNRSMESMDRTEETTLTSQGWVPFVSAVNWKETPVVAASDSTTTFDTVSYSWTDTQFVLASNLDIVVKGKTSSRLVCLLDAIAYSLANPSRHGSGSIRFSALEALMKLLQKIPQQVLALASRWIHGVLASLFDTGLPAGVPDITLNILTVVAQHWSGTQTSSAAPSNASSSASASSNSSQSTSQSSSQATLGASHVVLFCLTQSRAYQVVPSTNGSTYSEPDSDLDSSSASQSTKELPHFIWNHLLRGFAGKDPQRLIAIWGPLVICLRDGLFKHNTINAMLKLLQSTFTHVDPALRSLSFNAWSHLICTFTQTTSGIRMAKRLKLLLMPIARAFTQEDDLSVLHAAFETYLQLLNAVRTQLYLDWHVLLAQPLQLLLKNPFASVPFDVDPTHRQAAVNANELSSSAPVNGPRTTPPPSSGSTFNNTGSSLPGPHPPMHVQLSMMQRFCLLVCQLMQRDVSGHLISPPTPSLFTHGVFSMSSSAGIAVGFDPNDPLRLRLLPTHTSSSEFKVPFSAAPLMRVASMELHVQRLLNKLPVDPEFSAPVWKSLPALNEFAPWHSFLSLVLCLIQRCILEGAAAEGHKREHKQRSDLVIARHLWTALYLNLENHLNYIQQLHSRSRTTESVSVANWTIRGVSFDPANIASWALTQLLVAASSIEESRRTPWTDFLDEATAILSRTFATLMHTPIPTLDASHTAFGYFCQWLIQPKYLDSPESSATSDVLSLPQIPFFASSDLVGSSFDLQHEQSTQIRNNAMIVYSRKLYASVEQILIALLPTIPQSAALDMIHALFRRLQPHSTYEQLQHVSQELVASTNETSSPTLQDARLRLSITYTTWRLLAKLLGENVKSTCRVYPHDIYHRSSPTKARQTSAEEKIGGVKLENGSDAATASSTTSGTNGSNGNDSATLPSMYTIGMGANSSITKAALLDEKSTSTTTSSNQTTPTKSSYSTSASNTSDNSFCVTETTHPRVLLGSVLECLVYPLQQTKRTLRVFSALQDDTHPGSLSTISYLLETVFTAQQREDLSRESIGLIANIVFICSHRYVDLHSPPPPSSANESLDSRTSIKSGSTSTSSSRGDSSSIANLSAIFYVSAIQLLHQLRDHITFLQLDAAKAGALTQSADVPVSSQQTNTQSKMLPKITLLKQQVRLWYLALWNDVFVALVDGLVKISPLRPPATPVYEQLWSWRDVISYSSCDLPLSSKELADGAKLLQARVSNATSRSSKPLTSSAAAPTSLTNSQYTREVSNKAKELTLAPFPKDDMDAFFELSTPDWSLIWSEVEEKNPSEASSVSEASSTESGSKPIMKKSSSSFSPPKISLGRKSSMTDPIAHLDFTLFAKMPQPEDTGDESKMSEWSRFMRRVVCCYGMIWRSAIMAAKGTRIMPQSPPAEHLVPTSPSEALALSITTSVHTSALHLLEKWTYGNNLLIDILPVMCWALTGDAATAKVARANSPVLSGALKKPLEKLSGATLACIGRSFGSLVGDLAATIEVVTRPSVVNANSSLMALYLRSAPIWQSMFDSKRPNVRNSAWHTWNHSFGRVVKLDLSLAPELVELIYKAHLQMPSAVTLQEPTEWKHFIEGEPVERMDVDEPPAKVQPSPSIPVPATLFPIEHKHKHDPDYVFGDSVEMDTPTELGAHVSPYKPIPAVALKKKDKPVEVHPPSKVKPSNVTMKFPNQPQNVPLKLGAVPVKSEPSPDPSPVEATPAANGATMTLAVGEGLDGTTEPLPNFSDEAPSVHAPTASSAGSGAGSGASATLELAPPQKTFQQWSAALKELSQNSTLAFEDPSITIEQLVEAQQTALQLATSIAIRMTKR